MDYQQFVPLNINARWLFILNKRTLLKRIPVSADRKNEANEMFIIWLLVWESGNKCRTSDLTFI